MKLSRPDRKIVTYTLGTEQKAVRFVTNLRKREYWANDYFKLSYNKDKTGKFIFMNETQENQQTMLQKVFNTVKSIVGII